MGIIDKWTLEMNKQGILNEHINKMKSRVLQRNSEYELYYDKVSTNEAPVLVDVNKINGIYTGWPTAGRSIYELFFSVTGELQMNEKAIHKDRIKENLNSLINNGIKSQYNFYMDKEREQSLRDGLPEFYYYMDDDVYFSGATHRTVSAIMFNAPQMIGYVTNYKKNYDKYNNYLIHIESMNKWRSFLNSKLEFIIIKSVPHAEDEYQLYLKGFSNVINFDFQSPITEASSITLEDQNYVKKVEKKVDETIKTIRRINNSLDSMKLGVLPMPFRILKRWRLHFLYSLLKVCFYNKNNIYLNINDLPEVTAKKIQKLVQLDIIKENFPSN